MPDDNHSLTPFPAGDWRAAIDALALHGHVVLPAALPVATWQWLRAEAVALQQAAAFAPARVGRGEARQRETAVRGDALCWLAATHAAGSAYLAWMETLRLALNRELFLGLQEFEAHYAHYPVGAFYKKHVDRHRDSHALMISARVISAVLYLNGDWPAGAGGELVMYADDGCECFRQRPDGGTLVLFRSEDKLHEVLPATRERWSIAGWFRTRSAGLPGA